MKKPILLIVFFLQIVMYSQSDAAKYLDAIYHEEDVPDYVLPELLISFKGKKMESKEDWEKLRRPELIKFFEEHLYGKVPVPSDPVIKNFMLISESFLLISI